MIIRAWRRALPAAYRGSLTHGVNEVLILSFLASPDFMETKMRFDRMDSAVLVGMHGAAPNRVLNAAVRASNPIRPGPRR